MEIEVGEYVRTTKGYIFYINRKERLDGLIFLDAQYGKIIKHSKNIIDLVEVGDYVNLERVLDITGEYIRTTEKIHNKSWLSSNIKSIVTHEQFSSIEYKVESEEK